MANFEYEFSNQDRELVTSQDVGQLTDADYIKLSVYTNSNTLVTLENGNQAIFYSSLSETPFDINVSPFTDSFDSITPRPIGGDENDFKIYRTLDIDGNVVEGSSVYLKPNEIFNDFELPQGNFIIKVDFLNQLKQDYLWDYNADGIWEETETEGYQYQFIIKEISTSRKEVRLKLKDRNISTYNNPSVVPSEVISHITKTLNNNTDEYAFKHLLNFGTDDNVPIMNYQFDSVTDGKDNQSLILKLYDQLPLSVNNLSWVTIEKEVLITQNLDIYYFSDVEARLDGDGLTPDGYENWVIPNNNNLEYQNYNDLTSSLSDPSLDGIISSSVYDYPNLNTDFRFFENHTFFGSAKRKLVNFKNKVGIIQGYYSEISKSLYSEGVAIDGDSTFIKEKRQNLFTKINEEIKSFTPYERFLYFDGQGESTASAPGLGLDYSDKIPVNTKSSNYEQLNNYDGINTVYKNTNLEISSPGRVDLFTDKYRVHEKPFFNYSSSVYISFLLKATEGISLVHENSNNTINNGLDTLLPAQGFFKNSILEPSITGSEYKRVIIEASQSYFIPNDGYPTFTDFSQIDDFARNSTQINILSGSIKTGSHTVKDSSGKYQNLTTVVTSSGIPFFGSAMSAGELFRIYYLSDVSEDSEVSQSFVTDIKVTVNNPINTLPFDNIYHTSSTDWTNWYDTMYTNAENFDTNNIHSLENNLPIYIKNDSNYNEFKEFLSLKGEQYDTIRNHIDSLKTISDRGYKKTDSPPENTYPMLLDNMGWEAINPFSGSLSDSLGSYLTSVTSIDDIKNNTWRKTLNNLIYLYKTKGTKNSVRGLLNVYGYPPDVLQIQEFGGVTSDRPGEVLSKVPLQEDNSSDLDLAIQPDRLSFTSDKDKITAYMFQNKPDRILTMPFNMDDANVESFEFTYKHNPTIHTQTILESSGSGTETLWDLRLLPSVDGISSSFEFRLNNSNTGSSNITGSAVSMSTNYTKMHDGQLWNVMLQRMSSSISGSGTNEYRLHTSLQDDTSIQTYNYVTMSVSGGLSNSYITGSADNNYYANQNFILTGSRAATDSSNLVVGRELSGSLAQIKAWSTPLSISRFRQHTLNKFSTIGNTIDSHRKELVYHFKLNENYSSASVSSSTQKLNIIDASPTTTYKDYSFKMSASLVSGSSLLYGFSSINNVKFETQDNNKDKKNDNHIIINSKFAAVSDLNPIKSSIKSMTKENSKPLFNTSVKLEFTKSPTDILNQYILNNMDTFNFENFYGNPIYNFSSSYTEFDTLRKNFFNSHNISVDINKFIKSHENIFNTSLVDGVKSLVPARSTLSDKNSNIGVMIKPTILEKQKIEYEKHSVEVNPNSPSGSITFTEDTEFKITSLISTYEEPKSGSISMGNSYITSSEYSTPPFLELNGVTSSVEFEKSGLVSFIPMFTGSLELPYSASISMGNSYITSSLYVTPPFIQLNGVTSSVEFEKSGSISGDSLLPQFTNLNSDGTLFEFIVFPKSGSIDYASHANKSFVNIHDSWAQTDVTGSDTHFINYNINGRFGLLGGTGSMGDYNIGSFESRYIFNMIGDTEVYSSSRFVINDYSNHTKYYNRTMLSNDVHSGVTYRSYINGNPGEVTGRMIGKTSYFSASADGVMILPSNHISKYPNHFKDRMIGGTQNINPGILNVRYEDYATASFYYVDVTGGETQLKVGGNTQPSLDKSNRIIY